MTTRQPPPKSNPNAERVPPKEPWYEHIQEAGSPAAETSRPAEPSSDTEE
jgi:hypothetical protein